MNQQKEIKQRLNIEKGLIFNRNVLMPPETLRKHNNKKSVHDDVICGITAKKRQFKFETWWHGYSLGVMKYVQK